MKKLFPLLFLFFLQASLFSQVSTVRQVFNFSVGDTFEYNYGFGELPAGPDCAGGYIIDVITSVFQQGDTIKYGYSSFTTGNATCLGGAGASACIGPLGPFPRGGGMVGLTSFQTSGADTGFFQVYNLDSLIFNSPGISVFGQQPCDTPYCHTSTAQGPAWNGRKQSAYFLQQLSTIRERYVDSIGLVSRNSVYEYSPSSVAVDTLIYYRKAATGETGGQFVAPVATNTIAGNVIKNGAICASVYLIKQDTIGHLVAVDSVNLACVTSGAFQFTNMPADTYYVKAALTTPDTNYANYLPTYYYDSLHWANAVPIVVSSNGTAIYPLLNLPMVVGSNPGGPGFVSGWVSLGAGAILNEHNNYSRSVGSPLSHVQINLLTAGRQPVGYTYTDSNGYYYFNNLAYGSYMLYAEELNKIPTPVYFTLSALNPVDTGLDISVNSHIATTADEVSNNLVCAVFPNPAADNFTLVVSDLPPAPTWLKLYDVTGREIKCLKINGAISNIQRENLAGGIYCWQLLEADRVLGRGKLVLR